MLRRKRIVNRQTRGAETGYKPPNYEQIWYCVRLCSDDTFPDGSAVPGKSGWSKTTPPIWIKIGESKSWDSAITFGSVKRILENAARDFGAKQIVWLDKKNKTDFPEISQDTRFDKRRGVVNGGW